MKFFKWLAPILVFVAAWTGARYAVGQWNASQPGLEGSTRANFVNSAIGTCLPRQVQAPDNKGLSRAVLETYCRCYGEALADGLSPNDLVSMSKLSNEAVVALMQPRIQAAFQKCQVEALK